MKINIAIDGPSASGKSTIARLLAKRLGYIHIDTGAMYRGTAYKAKKLGLDILDEENIAEMLKSTSFSFDEAEHLYVDGVNVSKEIREKEMDMLASNVSTLPRVRAELVIRQQDLARSKGFILDGRDIGTVVLKDAEVKIFQTASTESRAKRRHAEHLANSKDVDFNEIYEDLKRRDTQDSSREHSPLRRAEDAIEIDTSDMSIIQVIERIDQIIAEKLTELKAGDQHD